MRRHTILFCFALGLGVVQTVSAQSEGRWPLDGDIDLSSGFGDYRENRFHAGIDLRTGGQIGKPVLAPVDGYVSRVKTAYTGYGRALYFRGSDGYLYVFGHLFDYFPLLEKKLRSAQVVAERYYVDLNFPADSIPVKKGELLAHSGETGVGAPHLHFEKRTLDNLPLNPLTHGFGLKDKTEPVFTEVGFQLTDDHSLLQNGRREMYLPVVAKKGEYRIDTVLYFNAPFGMLAECYDMMDPEGMKQAVYKLSVFINDTLYYQTCFDSLSYDQADAAKLEYDYFKASDGEKRVRRLYYRKGDSFTGSTSSRPGRGVFGMENETPGVKKVRIVAEDAFGNAANLSFSFIWGPPHALFALDSTHTTMPDTTRFYFHATVSKEQITVDSIAIFLNRGDQWGRPPSITITKTNSERYVATAIANTTAQAVLQLAAFMSGGTMVMDTIFSGIRDNSIRKLSCTREFVDGGMLIAIDSRNTFGSTSRIELYYHDSLLGTEYTRYYTMQRQIAFIPAQAKYSHITRIGAANARDPKFPVQFVDSGNIITIGVSNEQTFSLDNAFNIKVKQDNLYTPQFLELKKHPFTTKGLQGIISDTYEILPETMLTRTPFTLQLQIESGQAYTPYTGLCWLDTRKNSWAWLGGNSPEGKITATTYGGGMFAGVLDKEPPVITIYGVKEKGVYSDSLPKISFRIADDISGIEDDRNMVVKLNNKWVPVEFDMEKQTGRILLPWRLPEGANHLGIIVTDRAGHKEERYMQFTIQTSANR